MTARLRYNTALTWLDVSDNALTRLPNGLLHDAGRSLVHASFARNALTSLPVIKHAAALTSLHLQHNKCVAAV